MEIVINRNNDTPIYLQIKNEIKEKIIGDELPSGFKLPTERAVASELGVSRNTVVRAYQELMSENLIVVSSKPKGYFVKEPAKQVPVRTFHPLAKMIRYNYTEKENMFQDLYLRSEKPGVVSFAGISVNVADEENVRYSYKDFYRFDGSQTAKLKGNICRLLAKQDIFVNERNIQLVSETNQAIDYIIRLYLREGDSVIVEEPVIADTVNVFRNHGIHVVCVRMNSDGMDLDELEKLIAIYEPKFIHTMPNFHNPTGYVMPVEKRLRLLDISARFGIPIIEDNSLRDFRYEGTEFPTLYSMDKNKLVIYLDTFSLTFLPGISTAFAVGPSETIEMMGRLIASSEVNVYKVGHAMLNEAIENGNFERRVSFLKEYYRQKRDCFANKLEALKDKGLEFEVPQGGLFFWCKLPRDVNEKKLFAISKEKGLLYMPGSVFFPYGYSGSGYIRLCFSNASEEDMGRGIKILAEAIELSRSNFERQVPGAWK